MSSTAPPSAAKRSYDHLITTVEADIFAQRLPRGAKLPSERELQQLYGLSRSTVREALRVLEQRGLIEIRKGARGGAFVAAPDPQSVSKTLADFMRLAQVSSRQIIEFRESIESVAAGFAAERATDEDIATLNDLLAQARAVVADDGQNRREFYRVERRLHLELARISKNTLFEWIAGSIAMHYWELVEPPLPDETDEPRNSLEDWLEIITAIENREIMHVQSVIRSHLGRHRSYLRKLDRQQGQAPIKPC